MTLGSVCNVCTQVHERCTGHVVGDDESKRPCMKWPRRGARVCQKHGGNAPQVRAAAAVNVAQERANRTLAQMPGIVPVDDPIAELALLAGEVKRWRDFARERMDELQEIRYEGLTAEQIRGEVVVYERAMAQSIQVLTAIAKLGITERMAAVNEKVGAAIEQVLTIAFDEIELTDAQRVAVLPAIRRGLAAVS